MSIRLCRRNGSVVNVASMGRATMFVLIGTSPVDATNEPIRTGSRCFALRLTTYRTQIEQLGLTRSHLRLECLHLRQALLASTRASVVVVSMILRMMWRRTCWLPQYSGHMGTRRWCWTGPTAAGLKSETSVAAPISINVVRLQCLDEAYRFIRKQDNSVYVIQYGSVQYIVVCFG